MFFNAINQSIGAKIRLLASHTRLLANDEHLRSRFRLFSLLLLCLFVAGPSIIDWRFSELRASCAYYEDYEVA